MENRLPCVFSGVRSNIESGDGWISLLNFEPHFGEQGQDGISFGLEQALSSNTEYHFKT